MKIRVSIFTPKSKPWDIWSFFNLVWNDDLKIMISCQALNFQSWLLVFVECPMFVEQNSLSWMSWLGESVTN